MLLEIFEIIILTLINAGGIFLIIILLANSLNNQLYRWFAVMTISIVGWVNFSYLGYTSTDQSVALIFFRLNMASVAVFFFAEYMLYIQSFLNINRQKFRWAIFTISVLFFVIALFSGQIISGITLKDFGNEIIYGPINDYFSLFALLLNVVIMVVLGRKYFAFQAEEKKKTLYFLIGTFLFILLNIIFNIVVPELLNTARYQRLGDYAAVFFVIFTAYAILTRKFMNVKTALTSLLIGIIGMLIIVDIFALSDNLVEQGIKAAILIFFVAISVLLVRSVLNEIRQREELAKANKALAESRQKYIDLATEQKDIIDVMGHEARTPLTAIVQEIKLHKKHTLPIESELLEEAKDLPKLSKTLPYLFDTIRIVDRASAHAVALVTDMLETARLDKGRFELNYSQFDLMDLVNSSVDLMNKTGEVGNNAVKHQINFKMDKAKLMVEADETRIGQAVYAILNNALKYHDPQKDNIVVDVSITHNKNNVKITFVDNGIGIEKSDIAKLGKKFVRLNPKTKGNLSRPGGTGLGLFVVSGVMQHHGGKLIIDSDGIGKGSTFTLQFPIKRVV